MNKVSPRPVFVVGTYHSGTYLLVNVLGRHSRVVTLPGESHYFVRRAALAHRFAAIPERERCWPQFMLAMLQNTWGAIDEAAENATVARLQAEVPFAAERLDDMLQSMMTTLCEHAGATHWVEKSPSHIAYLSELRAAFPDALVLHIVRDPKSVLTSTKLRSIKPGPKHTFTDIYHPLHESISWREAVRRGDAFGTSHPEDYLEIRFEDLIIDSRKAVVDACNLLQLDYEETMLEVEQVNPSVASDLGKEGFDRQVLSRWRQTLTPAELFLLSWVCGPEIANRSYEMPASGWPFGGLIREAIRLPSFLYRKLARAMTGVHEVGVHTLLNRIIRKYRS